MTDTAWPQVDTADLAELALARLADLGPDAAFKTVIETLGLNPKTDFLGGDFSDVPVFGIDFTGGDLRGAVFDGATVVGCLFEGARLDGASFRGAKMFLSPLDEVADGSRQPTGAETAFDEAERIALATLLGQIGDPRLNTVVPAGWDLPERVFDVPLGPIVALPGGEFRLGAQSQDPGAPGFDTRARDIESPVHTVTLSPYAMMRFPVTVAAWQRFLDEGLWLMRQNPAPKGRKFARPENWAAQLERPNAPVTNISWVEAGAFCQWLDGALPTEAQWEAAARGVDQRRYPWGSDEPSDSVAAFGRRTDHVVPVGIHCISAAGLSDMAGNAREWCQDWFGTYPEAPPIDYEGPGSGDRRVLRGGSFSGDAKHLRAAYRDNNHSDGRLNTVGFRVVWRSAVPGTQ